MKILSADRETPIITTRYTVETESGDIIIYTEYQEAGRLKVIDWEAEYETTTTLEPITEEMIEEIQKLIDEEIDNDRIDFDY
jgi:hypothetical protein